MRQSYMDYAMSVIIGRALPDARDGLKPVHRRVLYAMYDLGNDWNRPYKKSARIVGDVIGKYHPHGDVGGLRHHRPHGAGLLHALPARRRPGQLRLGRRRSRRRPCATPRSAWRASPASCWPTSTRRRSTSSRTTTTRSRSRVVLPARIPNLLINGSSGIAVGMATNIPPHNLGEVVDALIALIENPDLTVAELMQLHPRPGLPHRRLHPRPRGDPRGLHAPAAASCSCAPAPAPRPTSAPAATSIIVTEIPYQVNKARLIERIAELVNEKQIEGISDLRDESDRDGMRIVIELKRDAIPEIVLNQLYKLTPLQESFGIIMLAIVDSRPEAADPEGRAAGLHRPPQGGRHPAHGLRAAQGRGAPAHPRRPEDRPRPPRRGHHADPRRHRPGRRARPA